MKPPLIDGQWLDFYALLDVPVNADEDTLRRRIGKIYAEASANSEHRDLARRHYFQALIESVLPQCRRVLLDAQWRAKYDRQHILHGIGDPSAQPYVSFIAAMRGQNSFDTSADDNAVLPQRVQEEITLAREVVETARAGAELELLPSHAVSQFATSSAAPVNAPIASVDERASQMELQIAQFSPAQSESDVQAPVAASTKAATSNTASTNVSSANVATSVVSSTNYSSTKEPHVETIHQRGEPVRAQTLTAQEAADIRRRRASNLDASHVIIGETALTNARPRPSRVVIENEAPRGRRVLSPTSLNLMVAITGVLFTISIQQLTSAPAVATGGRVPITIAVAPELEASLSRAETEWERGEGAGFDIIWTSAEGEPGVRRALSRSAGAPDAWIPSDSLWVERFNALAAKSKREPINAEASLVQTPMVLVARADRASELRRRFPDHRIPSWAALRDAVRNHAPARFGLADPQKTATGALARFSMAREWGAARGLSAQKAASNPGFWNWMSGFEDNVPANVASSSGLLKDLVLGTTGRFWWAVGYESEALSWIDEGKDLEIYYLPRTTLADHPFCTLERVGAPVEVARGRASFARFLRSEKAQKTLLREGFRPTEIAPTTKVTGNPFTNPQVRARGARLEGLPRDERPNFGAIESIAKSWTRKFG